MSPLPAFHGQRAHHLHGGGGGGQSEAARAVASLPPPAAAGEPRQSHRRVQDEEGDVDDADGRGLSRRAAGAGGLFTSANTTGGRVTAAATASAASATRVHGHSGPDNNDDDDEGGASPPPPPTASGRRAGKRPAARGTAFYPRKRANTACQVCRARKTKCDNKRPSCTYCESVGATCIQSPVDLSSFDPASLKILDRLDDLERLLRSATVPPPPPPPPSVGDAGSGGRAAAAGAPDPDPDPDSATPAPGPTTASAMPLPLPMARNASEGYVFAQLPQMQTMPFGAAYDDDDGGGHDDDQRLSARGSSGTGHLARVNDARHGPRVNSVLPQRIDHILQWPVFRNSSNHVFLTPPPPTSAACDTVSSPATAATTTISALVDMESHRIYRLLDNFFLYIHCKNPILDEPSARRMVVRAFLDGIDWSAASCLALLICALGSVATPFGPSPETRIGTQAYADAQAFFLAAQKRIGVLLVKDDIIGAQCLFLSGVYMMMVEFKPVHAWRFFNQALAACQHLPFLSRAQTLAAGASPDSMEMGVEDTQEQAVYWSAWKSERELRGELSLPDFDIRHSGSTLYPPFFPAPPVPPAESPDGPSSETQRSRAAWLFYLAEISLRRLTSRLCSEVLTLRQRYASSDSAFLDVLADMTPEYEAQAREWSDSLPAELSIHTPIDEDGIERSVLRGRLINLFEMVYWPFVMASLDNSSALPPGNSSSNSSSNSSNNSGSSSNSATGPPPLRPQLQELARRGLDTHVHQLRANEPGFFHRHHGGFFMIRACTRSALTLVAAARTGCKTMPEGWEEAVYKAIGMLAYWEDEDPPLAGWKMVLEREMASIQT
ncbi:GAL4-like Zn(II)2Cys6 (or C6 zinc) binuclear cluster DNA-binding domain [Purpureocillium takamizusanense]|uniref:GAL4-like Zn(II)2Cys6 (Or C6 zinc) binuclear cluster DNA-binding domain n=1 Tax=Purpureocillium takamizusanense TaxID=2060973 RepID=A0A9Q8QP18_9HYPO|nr:GAL4-like Zn(II)2Cys6 (or C6 zinc) binuclear cluster DNA-binding domain [Purpureocillium takamizusanense]UNI23260.1 GAL4-like Zn(II)2Cys6 (or C6 zinc) binuclear cluster DNA-binding domain [Purpureocillium takamizusanense]